MKPRQLLNPFSVPIAAFALAILAGAVLLHSPHSLAPGANISWLDAAFTAVSAVCVTGLIVVDTGSHFSLFGQTVILVCIQLGGLGLMTYASLIFYLWRRRVSLNDRLAVGQQLLHDPAFDLGRFLLGLTGATLGLELLGALMLRLLAGDGFSWYSALFHSVSAFCNAGFSLHPDSLTQWSGAPMVNIIFLALITLGGLGFSVLAELAYKVPSRLRNRLSGRRAKPRFSLHTRTVLSVSLFLSLAGAGVLWLTENYAHQSISLWDALFQSVTCRTAGFNTVDIASLSTVSLAVMMLLMFVGGSPGSCAGGIKTTTFRALLAFIVSQARGREQQNIGRIALDKTTFRRAMTLTVFALGLLIVSSLALSLTEGAHYPRNRAVFLELVFETVSAFGTVGLSTGVTETLSAPGKCIIMGLMFLGRLGPILFLSLLQSWQQKPRYQLPEEGMLIG